MHPYSILVCALLNDYFWTILALIASWVQLLEIWRSWQQITARLGSCIGQNRSIQNIFSEKTYSWKLKLQFANWFEKLAVLVRRVLNTSLIVTVWCWTFLTGIVHLQLKAEKYPCKAFSKSQLKGRQWRIQEQRKSVYRSFLLKVKLQARFFCPLHASPRASLDSTFLESKTYLFPPHTAPDCESYPCLPWREPTNSVSTKCKIRPVRILRLSSSI